MISFHKLNANYFSLASFKSVISIIKFSLSAELRVQAWGSGRGFHRESWGLHAWKRYEGGYRGDFESP